MKIKIKDLETFATDLEEMYGTMERLSNKGIPSEHSVYQDLLEATIQMNIELIPDEPEIPQSKTHIGWIIWYNPGSRQSFEFDELYSSKESAQLDIDQVNKAYPQEADDNKYSIKEVFI
jgi:hypothetical protein